MGPPILRLLAWSWRVTRRDLDNFLKVKDGETAYLITAWHGRTLTFAPLHSHTGLNILVSPSPDGRMVEGILERLGYGVIWGSSNRRSAGALLETRTRLRAGDSIGMVPDGPVGPRHSVNIGVAWLARETGLPIITAALSCDRAWRLRSWDRMLIPKIGAKLILTYGEPILVPADSTDDDLSEVADRIRERMMRDEEEGFRMLGVDKDW